MGEKREVTFRFAVNQVAKLVEQIVAVVRAGRSFRVVLNAVRRKMAMANPFDCLVVEIAVSHFEFGRESVFGDGKAVILRGDFHSAGGQIHHRLIRSAMAEFELKRLGAAGQ